MEFCCLLAELGLFSTFSALMMLLVWLYLLASANAEVPHNSNLTINMIFQVLKKYSQDLHPLLYIQLDSCMREIKTICDEIVLSPC